MKSVVRFGFAEENWTKVTITGPTNITMPVLKYLIMRLVSEGQQLTLRFETEGKD